MSSQVNEEVTTEETVNADGSRTIKTVTVRRTPNGTSTSTSIKTITNSTSSGEFGKSILQPSPKNELFKSSKSDKKKAPSAKDFEKQALKAHNEYRGKHSAPPLELSKDLCKLAQDWADRLATSGSIEHRPNNKYGENIFMCWGTVPTGEVATKSWYDEIKDYTAFGSEPSSSNFSRTGHFTQVVWKVTKKFGVAFASSQHGTFVVANYDPPGNLIGSYAQNVGAPK